MGSNHPTELTVLRQQLERLNLEVRETRQQMRDQQTQLQSQAEELQHYRSGYPPPSARSNNAQEISEVISQVLDRREEG